MNSADLKKQRERSRRVARIKRGIISFVGFMLLFLFAVCIVLGVIVFQLNAKIDRLDQRLEMMETAQAASAQTVEDEENLSAPSTSSDADTDDESADSSASDSAIEYGVEAHQNIYLTFDDGPSDNTRQILDILDQYNVKATFFVIGTKDTDKQNLYKEIVERGHTIGMHSFTHKYSSLYASVDSFSNEIEKEQDLIESVTGIRPWLFRFPGGSSNSVSNVKMSDLISYLNEAGVVYYDWNVIGGDATTQAYTTQDILDSVSADIGKYETAVVLLHDTNTKTTTVEALDDLIEMLQKRDADILPIDESTPLVQHVSYDSVD